MAGIEVAWSQRALVGRSIVWSPPRQGTSSSALLLRPPLVPLPCCRDDIIEPGNVRPPLQLACRTHGIADQSCGIPRSPFAEPHRYGEPRNTLDRRDHFANRIALAIPQVERAV